MRRSATNPEVNYCYIAGEVTAIVTGAYSTKNFDETTQMLKIQNELGCPFTD